MRRALRCGRKESAARSVIAARSCSNEEADERIGHGDDRRTGRAPGNKMGLRIAGRTERHCSHQAGEDWLDTIRITPCNELNRSRSFQGIMFWHKPADIVTFARLLQMDAKMSRRIQTVPCYEIMGPLATPLYLEDHRKKCGSEIGEVGSESNARVVPLRYSHQRRRTSSFFGGRG